MELRCNLLASLLDDLDEERKLTVFDAGSATPETVEFFSNYKCRLHFSDLFSREALGCLEGELTEAELLDHFQELLSFPTSTSFDLCLLWDVLNYLNEPALNAFTKILSRYLNSDTRIHGFATLKPSTPFPNQVFSLAKINTLKLKTRSAAQFPYYLHSQLTLNNTLSGMKVGKATLLANGLLEISFNKIQDA